jgi:HD domain-containing protein
LENKLRRALQRVTGREGKDPDPLVSDPEVIMPLTADPSTTSEKSRVLAGVTVVDTPLISRAMEYARLHSEPYLFNHAVRSWLFAVQLGQLAGIPYDAEVVAVGSLLHDLGLTNSFSGQKRFEIEGADAARAFALEQGLDERRAQLIWDSVALNSTPSIGLYKEVEVALCTAGIGVEFGFQFDRIPPNEMERILDEFPRLEMKQRFTDSVCRIIKTKPETTYDNFARDFGERFVPGYKPVSTVDYLLNSPFAE